MISFFQCCYNSTHSGAQKRARGSSFENVISYGEIRATKKKRKIGQPLFVLAVVLLDPSRELLIDTEVRHQSPVRFIVFTIPLFSVLQAGHRGRRLGFLDFMSVTHPLLLLCCPMGS
jgi:hypothetical protein